MTQSITRNQNHKKRLELISILNNKAKNKLEMTKDYFFFSNFVILIKKWKILYLDLDKALLFPRDEVIFLENWKLWRTSTTIELNNCCWNFANVSNLTISTKGCSEFFILFRSWVVKCEKPFCEFVETRSFLVFGNTPRSTQN